MLYTIGVGAFTALLSAGPGIYDNHSLIGGGFTLVGAVGLIGLGLLLIWYRVKIVHALTAALVVISIVLGYLVSTKPKEVIVHDPPTAEDIAKAAAPIQKELAAKTQELTTVTTDRDAEKQRAESATQQLATYQSELAAANKVRDDATQQLKAVQSAVPPKSPILGLDDAKRWQILKIMQDAAVDNQGQHIECHAVTSLTPDQNKLAFALYSEFVEILGRAWPGGNVQGFPTPPHQPFGITFLVGGHSGNAFECASHLAGVLQNILQIPIVLRIDQASDNLARCNNECVEMRYGGEH
jgi:hypothetical protein